MAIASEIFSGDSEKEFDYQEDIISLYTYLILLNMDRKDSFEMNGRGRYKRTSCERA